MATVLILGGTAEASRLAADLSEKKRHRVITSLAGRTRNPETIAGELRTGGFGGTGGMVRYLRDQSIDALIDATHPFAESISENALSATSQTATPLLRLTRPPWKKLPDDRWIEVADAESAAAVLPGLASRVFLTSGHRDLAAFVPLDDIWFLIRTIEPVTGPRPKQTLCLQARGPFDEDQERVLLQEHRIDALVTKASGGTATYAKIAAARRLGLPVIMIQRPESHPGPTVHDTEAAEAWLRQVTG